MMMLFAQTVARWDPELRAKQRSEGARGGALPRGLRRRAGSTLGSTIRCPVRFALDRAAAGRLRFVSIYQTLERLYALLSYGGFVVFDDIKFTQAQEAILLPST